MVETQPELKWPGPRVHASNQHVSPCGASPGCPVSLLTFLQWSASVREAWRVSISCSPIVSRLAFFLVPLMNLSNLNIYLLIQEPFKAYYVPGTAMSSGSCSSFGNLIFGRKRVGLQTPPPRMRFQRLLCKVTLPYVTRLYHLCVICILWYPIFVHIVSYFCTILYCILSSLIK